MENELTLNLIKEDFKGACYTRPCKCAISIAFKRATGYGCMEGVYDLTFQIEKEWVTYKHKEYLHRHFKQDKVKANQAKDGEVIRVIKLTKVN